MDFGRFGKRDSWQFGFSCCLPVFSKFLAPTRESKQMPEIIPKKMVSGILHLGAIFLEYRTNKK
jgi:hypothetical protein